MQTEQTTESVAKHTPAAMRAARTIFSVLGLVDHQTIDTLADIIDTHSDAPGLLAALRECLPIIDSYRRVSGGDGDITAMNARAAITKAQGND